MESKKQVNGTSHAAAVLAAVLRVDSTGWQPNASTTALAAALPTSTLFDLSRTHDGLWG